MLLASLCRNELFLRINCLHFSPTIVWFVVGSFLFVVFWGWGFLCVCHFCCWWLVGFGLFGFWWGLFVCLGFFVLSWGVLFVCFMNVFKKAPLPPVKFWKCD